MSRDLFRKAALLLPFFLLLGASPLPSPSPSGQTVAPRTKPLSIVTTVASLADLARKIGGDAVSVKSLISGSQNPHFVTPSARMTAALKEADLLIRVGSGLEDGWLPVLLAGSPNLSTQTGTDGDLDVSAQFPRSESAQATDAHPAGNPHLLLDPRNGILATQAIAARLKKLDPGRAAFFEKNATTYEHDLKSRISAWEKRLRAPSQTPIASYHRSWTHFAAWAGLKETVTVEEKPGIPPSPSRVREVSRKMKEAACKTLILEPYDPSGVSSQIAEEAGAKLLVLPTEVGASPQAETYTALFDTIVEKLAPAILPPAPSQKQKK